MAGLGVVVHEGFRDKLLDRMFILMASAGALFLSPTFTHSPCLCARYPLISRLDHSPSSYPSVRSILVYLSGRGIMQTLPISNVFRQIRNVSTHSHQAHREPVHFS